MKRARLILLDGVAPERELGICGALLAQSGDPEGAVVAARLRGAAQALGRWQLGAARLRRWTGGRATQYGDGIASLCAIAPTPQAWLDEPELLSGPRLLNRWARGLIAALGKLGVAAAYPGRDFVTVNGRQVAAVGLERARSGRLLFQAVIGLERPQPAEPDPAFPGLPPHPPASSVAEQGGATGGDTLRVLAGGLAQRLRVELVEAAAPEPSEVPPDPTPNGVECRSVDVPIGRICAALELGPDGRIARARLLGDWIAASADVETLESALVGLDPADGAALEALAARWLALPGTIAIGVTDPRQIADALQAAA